MAVFSNGFLIARSFVAGLTEFIPPLRVQRRSLAKIGADGTYPPSPNKDSPTLAVPTGIANRPNKCLACRYLEAKGADRRA